MFSFRHIFVLRWQIISVLIGDKAVSANLQARQIHYTRGTFYSFAGSFARRCVNRIWNMEIYYCSIESSY